MSAPPVSPLMAAYEHYRKPLLAYVCERLTLVDHRKGEELAQRAWVLALGSLHLTSATGMEEDIPAWLAVAARRAIREYLLPRAALDGLFPSGNFSLPTAA